MLRSLAATAFSDALSRGFFFLFNVVVARTIEPLEFGVYGLAISLGVWLWSIADAGLTGHGTRLLAQGADMGKTISAVLIARLPVLIALFGIFSAVLLILPLSTHERLIYSTAIIYVLGMSIFPAWIARSQHANQEYMLAYGTVALSGVFFLIIFLSGIVPTNGITASLARTLSWFVGAGWGFWLIAKRLNFRLQWSLQPRLLRKTTPLGIATIIYNLIPLLPFLLLRITKKGDLLASFSGVMQIQSILLAGARIFSSVFLPSIAKTIKKDDNGLFLLIIGHFRRLVAVVFPVFLVYAFLGRVIFEVAFGKKYIFDNYLILFFACAFLFASFRLSIDVILMSIGAYRKMAFTGTVVVCAELLLMAIFKTNITISFYYMFGELVLFFINTVVVVYLIMRGRKYETI